MPDQPLHYSSRKSAQEAHEAIRPSDVNILATSLTAIEADLRRLYQLIWQRFVACQMVDARFISTTVDVSAGHYLLRVRGKIMKFDGYQKILPAISKKEDNPILPDFHIGESLQLQSLNPQQHFTKPPARYNEASLVKELEKSGIGRPSTYASIIMTIQERGYAYIENKRFHAEKIGEIVTQRLMTNFADLMDYEFTARMEQQLDEIALGKKDWQQSLDEFYQHFLQELEQAKASMNSNTPVDIELPCEQCGKPMQIRNASTGIFLGCSGYNLPPKERCKATHNLSKVDEEIKAHSDEAEALNLRHQRRCQQCNAVMQPWLINEQYKLHICSHNPDCKGYELEQGTFKIQGYDGSTLECDKCNAEMQLRDGRFGKYFACTSTDCKNTRKLLRNGQPAPPKMTPIPMPELRCEKVDDYYLLRDGVTGLFLAASQYPKKRETRAPRIAEIKRHGDELESKYGYLMDAPDTDPDGNDVFVRYSRKTKELYLRAENDGKATGWSAFYRDSKWV